MDPLRVVLLIFTYIGAGYYLVSTWALVHHFGRKRKTSCETAAVSISVLKPVCGVDAEAQKNLCSFLDQDYSDYEVLFGVLDEDDPAVDLINECIRGRPNASIYTGSDIAGANNKVRILHRLSQHARGEIIVIADADTRVSPDCLRRVCGPFSDPSIGVITCMYRGIKAASIADMVEGLHMTCVFQPGVACADSLGAEFGLGALIAIRRPVLDAIGGFESIVNYLADDYQLAHRSVQIGKQIILSDYVIDILLSGDPPKKVLSRLMRWSQTLKVCNPKGYFGLMFTYGTAWSFLFCAVSGLSTAGLATAAGTVLLRTVTACVGAYGCLDDREYLNRFYLLPICDLLSFSIWIAACFIRTVSWRDRRLRISRDGKMLAS